MSLYRVDYDLGTMSRNKNCYVKYSEKTPKGMDDIFSWAYKAETTVKINNESRIISRRKVNAIGARWGMIRTDRISFRPQGTD